MRPVLSQQIAPIGLSGVSGLGIHPGLGALVPEWNAGDMAIVQKVGMPVPQFSHFEARRLMALGRDSLGNLDKRGWIGRLADVHFSQPQDVLGINVAENDIMRSDFTFPGVFRELGNFRSSSLISTAETNARRAALADLVGQTSPSDSRIRRLASDVTDRAFNFAETMTTATDGINVTTDYGNPNEEMLARSLPDVIRVMSSPLSTRVFYTRSEGFDTHGGQEVPGAANKPTLTERLNSVSMALTAFISDLKSPTLNLWDDTLICVFTEFGRRNAENQTFGTDHGYGSHMILLGGQVQGGLKGAPVTTTDLAMNNLPVEIDYRTVFSKCLDDWLCLDPALVFDGFTPLAGTPSFSIV